MLLLCNFSPDSKSKLALYTNFILHLKSRISYMDSTKRNTFYVTMNYSAHKVTVLMRVDIKQRQRKYSNVVSLKVSLIFKFCQRLEHQSSFPHSQDTGWIFRVGKDATWKLDLKAELMSAHIRTASVIIFYLLQVLTMSIAFLHLLSQPQNRLHPHLCAKVPVKRTGCSTLIKKIYCTNVNC